MRRKAKPSLVNKEQKYQDIAKKVEMKPKTLRQPQSLEIQPVPNQELPTHKQKKILRPKKLLPNTKHKQMSKHRKWILAINIADYQLTLFHQVLSVVQLGLGKNNGPWISQVPGNLEF